MSIYRKVIDKAISKGYLTMAPWHEMTEEQGEAKVGMQKVEGGFLIPTGFETHEEMEIVFLSIWLKVKHKNKDIDPKNIDFQDPSKLSNELLQMINELP